MSEILDFGFWILEAMIQVQPQTWGLQPSSRDLAGGVGEDDRDLGDDQVFELGRSRQRGLAPQSRSRIPLLAGRDRDGRTRLHKILNTLESLKSLASFSQLNIARSIGLKIGMDLATCNHFATIIGVSAFKRRLR